MRDICQELWGTCPERTDASPHVCDSERNPHAANHVCAYCAATLNVRDVERSIDGSLADVAADLIKREPDGVGAHVITRVVGNKSMARAYDGIPRRKIKALERRLSSADSKHAELRDELQSIVRRLDVMRHVVSFDATFNGPDLQVLDSARLHVWDALTYFGRRA